MSVSKSGFTVYRRYKPEKQEENMLKVGTQVMQEGKQIKTTITDLLPPTGQNIKFMSYAITVHCCTLSTVGLSVVVASL